MHDCRTNEGDVTKILFDLRQAMREKRGAKL